MPGGVGQVNKWLVIGLVAVGVLLLARRASAANVPEWEYIPNYRPGSGLVV